jgi:hypothetical protein
MNHPDAPASYVASVVTFYLEMPDTPLRVSVSDQWLARYFHQNGVPLETVETALLLGSGSSYAKLPKPCRPMLRKLRFLMTVNTLRIRPDWRWVVAGSYELLERRCCIASGNTPRQCAFHGRKGKANAMQQEFEQRGAIQPVL